MECVFGTVPINTIQIEHSIFTENWPRFKNNSVDNFSLGSDLVHSVLPNVNVKRTGVRNLFLDQSSLPEEHLKIIFSRPLTRIAKGSDYPVTHNFTVSVQLKMISATVNLCIVLMTKWLQVVCNYFKKAHGSIMHIRQSAAVLLSHYLKKGKKWCASTRIFPVNASSSVVVTFQKVYIHCMQRGPHEREARYLHFAIERPGVLIYIPHLLAHAVLKLDTGSPATL